MDALVEIGERGPLRRLLAVVANHDHLNRLHYDYWYKLADDMSERRLFALLRGVVLTEAALSWSGGSVAAGVWLARSLVERAPSKKREVLEWLREFGAHNDYLSLFVPGPSQSPIRPPRVESNPAEWAEYVERERQRIDDHKREQKEREARARAAQEAHARVVAESLARHVERKARRMTQLKELESLDRVSRLLHAIRNQAVTLDWYPPEWGELTADELSMVGEQDLKTAARRLRQRSGRSWRSRRTLFDDELRRKQRSGGAFDR